MYNEYTGQLEIHNVIHDYIENENKRIDRLTDEKIQRHYIQEIQRLNNIINKAIEYIHNHQLVFELYSKEEIIKWFDNYYKNVLYILKGEDKE